MAPEALERQSLPAGGGDAGGPASGRPSLGGARGSLMGGRESGLAAALTGGATARGSVISNRASAGYYGGLASSSSRASTSGAPSVDGSFARHRSDTQNLEPQPVWALDMWSLGAIFLEMCHGVPLWLSYKCRVGDQNSANQERTGRPSFTSPGQAAGELVLF